MDGFWSTTGHVTVLLSITGGSAVIVTCCDHSDDVESSGHRVVLTSRTDCGMRLKNLQRSQ